MLTERSLYDKYVGVDKHRVVADKNLREVDMGGDAL
jgi:hypothetical protein